MQESGNERRCGRTGTGGYFVLKTISAKAAPKARHFLVVAARSVSSQQKSLSGSKTNPTPPTNQPTYLHTYIHTYIHTIRVATPLPSSLKRKAYPKFILLGNVMPIDLCPEDPEHTISRSWPHLPKDSQIHHHRHWVNPLIHRNTP